MRERIEELEKELKRLKEEDAAQCKARRDSIKRQWRFTFTPVAAGNDHWTRIQPGSGARMYQLTGTVLNAEEMKAAGHSEDSLRAGGMHYIVNVATPGGPRIIKPDGGGNIYIVGGYGKRETEETAKTYAAIEAFLRENFDGGDVTEIIVGQEGFAWS